MGREHPQTCCVDKFCQGYETCRDNVVQYLVETLGFQPSETQNMHNFLDLELESKKQSLPGVYICQRFVI